MIHEKYLLLCLNKIIEEVDGTPFEEYIQIILSFFSHILENSISYFVDMLNKAKHIFFCFPLFLSGCMQDSSVIIPESQHLEYSLQDLISQASPTGDPDYFRFPEATQLDRIPQDRKNPLTIARIELGKQLYHDTSLGIRPKKIAQEYTYSCASCHHVSAGFQAGIRQGIGEGGIGFGVRGETRTINPDYTSEEIDVQPIRTPSALNVAYQRVMLWNGQFGAVGPNERTENRWTPETPLAVNNLGYEGVESQAIAGLLVHRMDVDSNWVVGMGYQHLFDDAFPSWEPIRRYSREAAGLAIAAYERTLLAQEAPFQRWLAGESQAMSEQEIAGAILFFDKGRCVTCHTGPALNKEGFNALGMNDLDGPGIYGAGVDQNTHLGRGGFTGQPSDNYKFKVPQLYNLKDSPFFGHGGNFESVRSVIAYKNAAVAENPMVPIEALDKHFEPLGLSEEEIDAITVFIEDGLHDPNLHRHVPGYVLSGFCFPNADQRSKEDLGCY